MPTYRTQGKRSLNFLSAAMTFSAGWLKGLLLCLVSGFTLFFASSALSEQVFTHSRVLLDLDFPEGLTAEQGQSRVLKRLIDRIMALDDLTLEQGVSARAVVAGEGPEGIYVDVDGLSCNEALRFVEGKVLDQDPIEIGLVGTEPMLRSWDVKRAVRTQEGDVILLLRQEGAKRLRDLTARHIGESVYIQLGENGNREVISIRAVIDSGRIQVRRENVPTDFARRPTLGYPAQVAGCTEQE
jgi:hypothetical protein